MEQPKICLTLTGSTLQENINTLEKYREYVDIAELRADFLTEEEQFKARQFPSMAKIPCILTIRRTIDGGRYQNGEASRTILFARALAFADDNPSKNFEYVDFEDDFHIPSLEEAALAFGTKIIRSMHAMEEPVVNICEKMKQIVRNDYEIPKIAFMPKTLDDVKNLFEQAENLTDNNHILVAMGPLGVPSRVLSARLKNFLTYSSPEETNANVGNLFHLEPKTLATLYHFKSIDENTRIFGITGWPLLKTDSPKIHNTGYEKHKMNSVYIPMRSENFSQLMDFVKAIGVQGFSVTIPFKEEVLNYADEITERVKEIGAANTMVKQDGKWFAYNTDAYGFERALLEFTGLKNLKHKKVAIIGAGGAAKAICYVIKSLGGKACIFNRTLSHAKELAQKYKFEYAALNFDSTSLLKKYKDVIIQTTSKGMNSTAESNEENDPLYFYSFTGKETLFDIVYEPNETPIMKRAKEAGCKVCNGLEMLKYQGWAQFKLFTGVYYGDN